MLSRFTSGCILSLMITLTALAGDAPKPKKAVPLKVDGDVMVVVKSGTTFTITAADGSDFYIWSHPDAVTAEVDENDDKVLKVTAAPEGTHKFSVLGVTYDVANPKNKPKKDRGQVTVVVGKATPTPTPPGPTPPGPTPPTPVPVPAGDLRVLIVYETSTLLDLAKADPARYAIIYDKRVRDLLQAKCGKDDVMNSGKAYAIWDKDTDLAAFPKRWQDALARPRGAVPFIHIFKGDTPVAEEVLPKNVDDTIALINKYAGG